MKINIQPPLLLITATVLSLCQTIAFPKEKEETVPPPPLAKTGVVSVYVDQPTEIPLQVAGRIVEPLSFVIRKEPRHGRLGDLKRTGRNSASVLYTPDKGTGAGDDVFSFAAQSLDSPVSAAATVWLRLTERPAILEYPGEIDFGKTFLGEKEKRLLILKNTGGGVASGNVRPNLPWTVEGTGTFRVSAGKETTVPLSFEPFEERDFCDKIQIGPDPKSVVLIKGSGVAPISWTKDGICFSPVERAKGTASIAFQNNSSTERLVEIEWPDFLKALEKISLPPEGSIVVKMDIKAPLSFNYEGKVEIRSGNFKDRIPIRIFPAPARLETNPVQSLKLGEVQKGISPRGRFLLRNTGGADAPIQIIAPPGVLVFPDPSNIILGGGQEQVFEVEMENYDSKPLGKILRIQSPACDPVELAIEAPAAKKSSPSLPIENFLSIPPPPNPQEQYLPTGKALPVDTAALVSSQNHEVEISWKVKSSETAGFKIERRRISPGKDGQIMTDWIPWPEVGITISDGTATASFKRLQADSFWTIRIISLDKNGTPSLPSPAFQITTQPLKELHIPAWFWFFCLLVLCAGGFHLWRQNQAALHAKEDERIALLEKK